METELTNNEEKRTVGLLTVFPNRPLGLRKFSFVLSGKKDELDVAVKKIPMEVWTEQKKKREGKKEDSILCKLDHENIIRFYHTETTPDYVFIAFQLCQYNLVQWHNEYKAVNWDPDEKRMLFYQACNGLAFLHKNNIIHRDVKPENILVNKISEESINISGKSQFQVKICDFGISRITKDGRSTCSQNTGSGTTIWMAPEVLRAFKNQARDDDKLTKASDIFALGCVGYWLLTDGHHPFAQDKLEYLKIENNIAGQYKQCLNLSLMKIQHLGGIRLIMQMIAEDPKDRPPAEAVLKHHFFFKKSDSLEFLKSVSNATETGVPNGFKARFAEIINDLYRPWTERLHPDLIEFVRQHKGRKTPYNENNEMDLDRFYRNVSNHRGRIKDEMPEIEKILNLETDNQYLDKILENFPFLVDDLWLVFQTMKEANIRERFYKTGYLFRISLKSYEKDQIQGFINSNLTSKPKPKPSNNVSATSSKSETEQLYAQQNAPETCYASNFNFKSPNRESEVNLARMTSNPVAGTSASARCSPYDLRNRPERNRMRQTENGLQPLTKQAAQELKCVHPVGISLQPNCIFRFYSSQNQHTYPTGNSPDLGGSPRVSESQSLGVPHEPGVSESHICALEPDKSPPYEPDAVLLSGDYQYHL